MEEDRSVRTRGEADAEPSGAGESERLHQRHQYQTRAAGFRLDQERYRRGTKGSGELATLVQFAEPEYRSYTLLRPARSDV
eukprot:600819-Rhodomonas_salina.3